MPTLTTATAAPPSSVPGLSPAREALVQAAQERPVCSKGFQDLFL